MKKGFLVPLSLCASITCQAGDYFIEPVFNTNERYDSNLFMRQKPLQANWISTLSPGVNFGLRHETGELKSNFTWNQLFYTNQSKLNIDEQLFSVDYKHKYERLEWSFDGSYNNRSSINTVGTVNGLDFTQVMAKQLSLAPTATYALTALSSLTFDYSYNKTAYEKTQNTSFFTDYDYHQASGTFNHLYTERDRLNATLSTSRYKSQPQSTLTPKQTTYNNVAQLGWQHSFSEQLITYVSAGINYSLVDSQSTVPLPPRFFLGNTPVFFDTATNSFTLQQQFETVNTKKNAFGQVYRASIQKSFERGSISLVGSQNQTPTSQGLQTQTQLTFNNAYTINERWTSGLSASYSIYDVSQQNNQLNSNRTYYSISPNVNWKWTPEINVGLSYNFHQQEFKSSNQASFGNTVQLQFSYQPQINHQVK